MKKKSSADLRRFFRALNKRTRKKAGKLTMACKTRAHTLDLSFDCSSRLDWLGSPVLSISGEKSLGNELAAQMQLVATDVTVVVLSNTGHWILEERPKETTDALVRFL